MGTVLAAILLLFASPLPTAERCAAMLLSPGAEARAAGKEAIVSSASSSYERAVLAVLMKRDFSRPSWIAALEKELPASTGPRHKEIRDLLRILRSSAEDNIGVDLVLLSVPRSIGEKLTGGDGALVVHSGDKAWRQWWKQLNSVKGATQIFTTSLVGKDGLNVVAEQKKQIAYVKGFELEGKLGHPVIAELSVGSFANWRPVLSRDGKHVTLEMLLRSVAVERPFPVKEVPIGELKARIQVPRLTERVHRSTLTVPLGGCAVFPFRGDPTKLVFVRVSLGKSKGVPKLAIPVAEVGVTRKGESPD